MTLHGPCTHADCRLYLARITGPMAVELVDGCHGTPEKVAEAAKLYSRIFNDSGPWAMVEVHPMPDVDPPINEDAARDCAYLVAEFGSSATGLRLVKHYGPLAVRVYGFDHLWRLR